MSEDQAGIPEGIFKYLDDDPARAQEQIEDIMEKLVFFFNYRKHPDAEDCAAEVLLRLVQKLTAGATVTTEVLRYAYGIARNIHYERTRSRQDSEHIDETKLPSPEAAFNQAVHAILQQEVLSMISNSDRAFLLRYYQDSQELAQFMGISHGTLRLRVYRMIRDLRRRFLRPPARKEK
jgi:DNA-directed RNA polymerase specialized sigma24 family protein